MKTEHPITPRPELVAMWAGFSARHHSKGSVDYVLDLANKAARWGADQELEACCQEVQDWYGNGSRLRAARRPKSPSLKEQALCHLESFAGSIETLGMDSDLIRRALEALPDV